MVLTKELENYIQADQDVIDKKLRLCIQQEKVNFLENILKQLHTRSFNIKNAIEFMKFQMGA